MTVRDRPPPPGTSLPPPPPGGERDAGADEARRFLRSAVWFVLAGLLLYGVLYVGSERLVYEHGERNRFHVIRTMPPSHVDVVILGASRAAALDYRDMNERLEALSGARVVNLATVGGGITINRLLLDYFLSRHDTGAVIYVLDSFAFYSREWNEDRLRDTDLYVRAPFDPTLVRLMWNEPAARSALVEYVSGFAKINNAERFEPDRFASEGAAFERTYRPIPQIDRQRIEFLYPDGADEARLHEMSYLTELQELIDRVRARGMEFVAVRPPVPDRFREMIPGEDRFDRTLEGLLARNDVALHDFTSLGNDPEFFYDSDHLNRDGVLNFFRQGFATLVAELRHGGDGNGE